MIYLDNAATTRPDKDAVEAALPYLHDKYFNPSALYGGGVLVQGELRRAREYLLSQAADKTRFELYFTSCGSEADNTAIFSAARRGKRKTGGKPPGGPLPFCPRYGILKLKWGPCGPGVYPKNPGTFDVPDTPRHNHERRGGNYGTFGDHDGARIRIRRQ